MFNYFKKNKQKRAYYRIGKIITSLLDLNKKVKEIKRLDEKDCWLEIKTKQGTRYLCVNFNSISFYEPKNNYFISLYTVYQSMYDCSINIMPDLVEGYKMTEEQIFLSLLEIENILSKYKYPTISSEHDVNMNKFIERF